MKPLILSATARLVNFEMKDKLFIGLRFWNVGARFRFLSRGLTMAIFQGFGNWQVSRDRLTMFVITGRRTSKHLISRCYIWDRIKSAWFLCHGLYEVTNLAFPKGFKLCHWELGVNRTRAKKHHLSVEVTESNLDLIFFSIQFSIKNAPMSLSSFLM